MSRQKSVTIPVAVRENNAKTDEKCKKIAVDFWGDMSIIIDVL